MGRDVLKDIPSRPNDSVRSMYGLCRLRKNSVLYQGTTLVVP
jgi:hypothetical protein